jgi:hypothetical protein
MSSRAPPRRASTLGAMAGTVDLVQRVSTGIEVRGDVLRLNPELPREMERLDMRIRYRGHSLDLRLTRDSLTVRGRDGVVAPISLCVDGKLCEFVSGTTRVFQLNDETTDGAIVEKSRPTDARHIMTARRRGEARDDDARGRPR